MPTLHCQPGPRATGVLVMLLPGLLGACGEPEAEAWVDPSADDDWSGLVDADAHQAEWTAEEVVAVIETGLFPELPLPHPVFDSYAELMSHTEEGCPGSEFNGGFLVVGLCSTEEGYQYSGSAGLISEDDRVYEDDGDWTGTALRMSAPADFVIIRPDGTRLSAGGNVTQRLSSQDGRKEWSTQISGTFQDDAASGWLGDGYSGFLGINAWDDGSEAVGTVDGYLTVNGVSLQLMAVQIAPSQCAEGATRGTIMVRQPDATWYMLNIEGSCSSCGRVFWNDEQDLGEACVDLSSLHTAVKEAAEW